jgi:Fe-S-cluster-containing dehydrogenase component
MSTKSKLNLTGGYAQAFPEVGKRNFRRSPCYTQELAEEEAACLQCKKPKCVEGCPVGGHSEFISLP